MYDSHLPNLFLWGAQGFLALFFFLAGAPKVAGRGLERWTGFSDLARPLVISIGIAEMVGAVGLVLPLATHVMPWLTPLAGVGLAMIVLMASGFHLRADERLPAVETAMWATLAAVVALGRWPLLPSPIRVPGWALIGALTLLVPSVILVIIVLLRRPVAPTAAGGGGT